MGKAYTPTQASSNTSSSVKTNFQNLQAPAPISGAKATPIASAYSQSKSSALRGFNTPKQAPQFNAKGPSQVTHETRQGAIPHISMHPVRNQ